jgi:hypothetical protein
MTSGFKTDITTNINLSNKINGTIKRHFVKNMLPSTKLGLYNITSKRALKKGSEVLLLLLLYYYYYYFLLKLGFHLVAVVFHQYRHHNTVTYINGTAQIAVHVLAAHPHNTMCLH